MTSGFRPFGRNREADRARAFLREQAKVQTAVGTTALDAAFIAEMRERQSDPSGVVLVGHAAEDATLPVQLTLAEVAGAGHALILGGSGAGKTRLAAQVALSVLDRVIRAPESIGYWLIDYKGEMAHLLRRLLGARLARSTPAERERFLSRYCVIDPFSTTHLVPMNVLVPETGVPPQLQAFEVATLIGRLGGAELGVIQQRDVYHLMLLGVAGGCSLPRLASLLNDPVALAQAAAASPLAEVREYFGGGRRITVGSREGVAARLDRLLRLPSTRLMLDADSCISFHDLLDRYTVVVDVGSPPLGLDDLQRFWSALILVKMTRAIFARAHADAARPVLVMSDEFQVGVQAGAGVVDDVERLVTTARSRGVSLWLISQGLAPVARVSPTLPSVLATNCSVQALFRAAPEDGRAMKHMLPVTGRRARPEPPPWEPRPGSPFLDRREELDALVDGVASLPSRTYYLWIRGRPYRAHLVRAAEVAEPTAAPEDLERRLQVGALARSVTEGPEAEARGRGGPALLARTGPGQATELVGARRQLQQRPVRG